MKILITGSAGFIGYHLAKHLLKDKKHKIFGLDSLNSYYSLSLKKNRLKELLKFKNFKFFKINLKNKTKITSLFEKNKFDIVIHLAAQAGVRYSVQNPQSYLDNNIISFLIFLILQENLKSNTLFLLQQVLYMEINLSFLLMRIVIQTNPYLFMQQLKKVMKFLLILIQIFLNCLVRA